MAIEMKCPNVFVGKTYEEGMKVLAHFSFAPESVDLILLSEKLLPDVSILVNNLQVLIDQLNK